ncbi:MAG: hypothetical protein ACREH8_10765 [Opitutaceae bacterium]
MSKLTSGSRTYITPLSRADLFDPGQVFPRDELLRRVLSVFWRNCCGIPTLARAPAPIVELCRDSSRPDRVRSRARAWWVLYDGIVEETEGSHSDRVELFFGRPGQAGQLWPRYEFEVVEKPLAVEMSFHEEPGSGWASRVDLNSLPDGSVRVIGQAVASPMKPVPGSPAYLDGARYFDLGVRDADGHHLRDTRT